MSGNAEIGVLITPPRSHCPLANPIQSLQSNYLGRLSELQNVLAPEVPDLEYIDNSRQYLEKCTQSPRFPRALLLSWRRTGDRGPGRQRVSRAKLYQRHCSRIARARDSGD